MYPGDLICRDMALDNAVPCPGNRTVACGSEHWMLRYLEGKDNFFGGR